jgi:U3 small nucleolar RNA-associated protein 25
MTLADSYSMKVQQLFERFVSPSPADVPSARFEFFKRSVWPRIKETGSDGQLIFIPHYFDFVRRVRAGTQAGRQAPLPCLERRAPQPVSYFFRRVRNFLTQEEADFTQICEYTRPPDVTAARSRFFHRHRRILLYTERAHFYQRHRIRGIKVRTFLRFVSLVETVI